MTSVSDISGGSALRITPQVISGQLISNITNNETQMASLEQQLSSGEQISQPSDNPQLASQIMQLNSSLARAAQYQTNGSDAVGWLSTANQTMNQVESILQNVRELVVSANGSSVTSIPGGLDAIATQVQGDLSQLTDLGNTTFDNQAIFAGTGTAGAAYDANGNYLGQGNAPTRTVAAGSTVAVGVTGPQVFGSGTTGLLGNGQGGAPVGVLQQIVNDLQTGTPASLTNVGNSDLDALDNAITNVTTQAGQLGALTQTAQTLNQEATAAQETLGTQLASAQGVNIAQATTDLQMQQNSYESALWAAAQLNQTSLISFLG